MGLHYGGMDAVSSWMCLVLGAWDSDMRRWLKRRCVGWGLVVVSILPTKRIRDRACRRWGRAPDQWALHPFWSGV